MNLRSVCSRFLPLGLATGVAMIVAPQWARAQTFISPWAPLLTRCSRPRADRIREWVHVRSSVFRSGRTARLPTRFMSSVKGA